MLTDNKKSSGLIGTKNESSLHRSLKFRYSGSDGFVEIQAGVFVCDGLTSEGEIIEVQIGSFAPLKEKLSLFARSGKVRIIHPIIEGKYIELYGLDGSLLRRRKSSRKGKTWDLFKALIYAPWLAVTKNLSIELAMVDIVEKRLDDGKGSWRRKGVSIADRVLAAYNSSVVLSRRSDYNQFVPFKKGESFTTEGLAKKAKINVSLARKTLYVLAKLGIVEKTGRQGNAFIYERKRIKRKLI